MKLLLAGEKKRLPCEQCQNLQQATYRYADFIFDDGVTVPQVLQAFCDCCGAALAVAPQSSSQIGRHRSRAKPTSVRIPPVLTDLANTLLAQAGATTEKAAETVFKIAVTATLDEDEESLAKKLRKATDSPLLSQPSTRKFSLTMRPQISQRLKQLQTLCKLASQSEAVKAFLVLANDEPKIQDQIRRFALLT